MSNLKFQVNLPTAADQAALSAAIASALGGGQSINEKQATLAAMGAVRLGAEQAALRQQLLSDGAQPAKQLALEYMLGVLRGIEHLVQVALEAAP